MLIAVDVGNSHTVVGLFAGNTLINHWRLRSDPAKTVDELAAIYHSFFTLSDIDPGKISGFIIASVVPSLEADWIVCCEKYLSPTLKHPPFVVSHRTLASLISIPLQHPEQVGADRLVNALSAWYQHKKDLIVIDFGTAITFDCVTKDCAYIGGYILPGIAISLNALTSRTAKLPTIDLSIPPQSILGETTVEAMKNGILYGHGAMADGLIEILTKEMTSSNKEVQVVATGGMANLITPYSKLIAEVDQMLTLKGLQGIFNHTHANA